MMCYIVYICVCFVQICGEWMKLPTAVWCERYLSRDETLISLDETLTMRARVRAGVCVFACARGEPACMRRK